jgi:hypothetical protein
MRLINSGSDLLLRTVTVIIILPFVLYVCEKWALTLMGENKLKARFQVLTAKCMKMTVFWDVVPCSLLEIDRRFRGAYCLHHQDDSHLHKLQAVI